MFVALRDLWRSKLRFGLLAGAIALLVFLLLFLSTLSATLLGFFVGAIENNSAEVLVYEDTARRNLQASRLDQSVVDQVAVVPGVAAAAPIGELTLTAEVGGSLTDLSLWGVDLDGPGGPEPIVEGRSPSTGEVVVDESGVSEGFEIGETITLVPSGTELEIVGYVRDVRYAVIATAYLSFEEWAAIYEAEFPGTPYVPLSLVGADTDPGEDAAAVGDRITASVAGVEGLDREAAAAGTPGVESISQSFALIVGITFGIVVLVVGCLVRSLEWEGLGFTGDASVNSWADSIRKIQSKYTKIETIVPGHGKAGDKSILDHTIKLAEKASDKSIKPTAKAATD